MCFECMVSNVWDACVIGACNVAGYISNLAYALVGK
jgi:hypothetical protein